MEKRDQSRFLEAPVVRMLRIRSASLKIVETTLSLSKKANTTQMLQRKNTEEKTNRHIKEKEPK